VDYFRSLFSSRNGKEINFAQGFTLVETLVSLIITIAVILGIFSSFEILIQNKKSIELSNAMNDFVQNSKTYLANPTQCDTALAGKLIDRAGANTNVTLDLSYAGAVQTFGAGVNIVPGLTLSKVQLAIDSVVGPKSINMQIAGVLTNLDQFNGIIRLEAQKSTGISQQAFYIPVKILTLAGGSVIQSCVSTNMESAETCVGIGYRWDQSAGICLPTNRCIYGGSFSNAPSQYGGFVNVMTGAANCPAGYTAQRSGTVNFSGKGNSKYSYKPNLYPVFECLKCVDAAGTIAALTPPTNAELTATYGTAFELGDGDLSNADAGITAQRDQLIASLMTEASKPGFVCKPPATVLAGTGTCPAPGVSSSSALTYCCSGMANFCANSFSIFGGIGAPAETISIVSSIVCQ
jgi:hypothetical protein